MPRFCHGSGAHWETRASNVMNETIRQLLALAPGIGSGLSGNGTGMQAFMDAYQRTQAHLDAQDRTKQQVTQQTEDRQRNITRQAEQDKIAAEDRQRQIAMQTAQLPGVLAKSAEGAETLPDAEQAIDALYRVMAPQLGGVEQMGGVRDVAMNQARTTITRRQKGELHKFLAEWAKTPFAKDAKDADPLVILTPRLASIVGKPEAKLSELNAFTEIPVSIERKPSDEVSLQDKDVMVGGKLTKANYNPKTGKYTDQAGNPVIADSVPPRPPASNAGEDDTDGIAQSLVDGTLTPSMLSKRGNYNAILARANKLSLAQSGKPYNAARAQTEYGAAQRFAAAMNGTQQQRFRALAGSVVNTIDEVKQLADEMQNSGVPLVNRAKLMALTQTAGNTPHGQLAAKYLAAVNTLKEEFASLAQGGYAPTESAWHLASQQINGDFGVKQMSSALTEVQRLINYRVQAFESLTPFGVSPSNPISAGGFAPGPTQPPTGEMIEAIDPQGKRHRAPKGTPLPAGWKLVTP